jgi:hypothetical protein
MQHHQPQPQSQPQNPQQQQYAAHPHHHQQQQHAMPPHPLAPHSNPAQGVELPRIHQAVLRRPWEDDAYVAEPQMGGLPPPRATLPPLGSLGMQHHQQQRHHLKRSLSPEQR